MDCFPTRRTWICARAVCWLGRPAATGEARVPGPGARECSCAVGEALIQSGWSLTLTPASLAESRDCQKWLCEIS